MVAIMLPVHPIWCGKIATGEKTIEVRKRVPKIPPPYKAYLYCTKRQKPALINLQNIPKTPYIMTAGNHSRDYEVSDSCFARLCNGKVWAECICERDMPLLLQCSDPEALVTHYEVPGTCLSDVEIMEYLGNGKEGHGLLLSELTIYDRPREITEFRKICPNSLFCESCAMYNAHEETCGNAALILRRPPQSWCYVEEIK